MLQRLMLFIALLLASPGHAAIVDCQPASGGFTVFLSEPGGDLLADKPKVRAFLQKLQFELDQNRDGRWIASPATDVRFVACFNRAPALDGSEFGSALIEGLHSQRVLLEVWGALSSEGTQANAQMNYLLVPMQFAANQHESAPAALQRLRYPEQGGVATPDPVQLIARPLDIDAFVAAAFGFKLLRERQHELAHRNLCRAASLLGAIARRPLAGRSKADVEGLLAFVRSSAGRAVSEARADPAYPPSGMLRLHDAAKPCAGGE